MLKGSEKRCFSIWLKVGAILSVKPINDFACEGFCKFAVDKGAMYCVWISTADADLTKGGSDKRLPKAVAPRGVRGACSPGKCLF